MKTLTWTNEGVTRKLTLVPLNKIRIDKSYQRPEDKRHLERIRANFNPRAFRTFVLSLRADGFYYAPDAQHRAIIGRERGYKVVPAEVHENLTIKEEAKLFVDNNQTKAVSKNSTFRANLKAGSQKERDIKNIAAGAGFMIRLDAGRPRLAEKGITIRAVGALAFVYDNYDAAVLEETLRLIRGAFTLENGHIQSDAVSQQFIKGVGEFLWTEELEADEVLPYINTQKHDASTIYKAAQARTQSKRSDPWREIADWFRRTYRRGVNKGRKAA